MIVPTIQLLNDTQSKKLQSHDRCTNSVIKLTVTSVVSCLNLDICMLVKSCLLNEINSDTFNNYFEITEHKMNTRNNNHSIRLLRVKLELAHQSFFCWWQSLKLPATGIVAS